MKALLLIALLALGCDMPRCKDWDTRYAWRYNATTKRMETYPETYCAERYGYPEAKEVNMRKRPDQEPR